MAQATTDPLRNLFPEELMGGSVSRLCARPPGEGASIEVQPLNPQMGNLKVRAKRCSESRMKAKADEIGVIVVGVWIGASIFPASEEGKENSHLSSLLVDPLYTLAPYWEKP